MRRTLCILNNSVYHLFMCVCQYMLRQCSNIKLVIDIRTWCEKMPNISRWSFLGPNLVRVLV